MTFVKTNEGRVELYKYNGSLIRTIEGTTARSAAMNNKGSLILITTEKGSVELFSQEGNLIRVLKENGSASATFIDKNILVFTEDGHIQLWRDSGEFVKKIA